jgi:putative NIF3 family GTP cyclohydrolase 1 type 2
VAQAVGAKPLVFPFGADPVRTLGLVTGAAPSDLHTAVSERLDAFLTGEPREFIQETAREERITFVAAGHYHTETFGVRSLGELLAEKFGLECEFVDVPNPV